MVLTGEGADEMFAGYDLFREAQGAALLGPPPQPRDAPAAARRLYPYLARSPVAQLAMAEAFFGTNLTATADVFYAHRPRWDTTARWLLLSRELRAADGTAVERLRASLPPAVANLSALARAQFIEVRTLLSGYLLSSQGDRMLMANSVEGRFPFLDPDVMALADALPDELKLSGLQEKVALKRAFADRIPASILRRKKQPYRAPVVRPFFSPSIPDYVEETLSPQAVAAAGVLEPKAVAGLFAKCRATGGQGMSNTDEMAFCAALSLQLIARDLIGGRATQPTATSGQAGDGRRSRGGGVKAARAAATWRSLRRARPARARVQVAGGPALRVDVAIHELGCCSVSPAPPPAPPPAAVVLRPQRQVHLLVGKGEVELVLSLRQAVRVRGRRARRQISAGKPQVAGQRVDLGLVQMRDGLHVGGAVAVLHEEALVVFQPVRRADDRVVQAIGVEVLQRLADALLEVRARRRSAGTPCGPRRFS